MLEKVLGDDSCDQKVDKRMGLWRAVVWIAVMQVAVVWIVADA